MSDSPKFQHYAFDKRFRGRNAEGVEVKQKDNDEKKLLKEVFGVDGFQVHHTPYRREKKKTPEWAIKDENLRTILLVAFPRLHINASQRKSAARWAQVIQLFYRQGWTETEVADEMLETVCSIRHLVFRIRKLAEKIENAKKADQ